jgi:hypothetical protein
MRKSITLCAITVVCSMVALLPAVTAALAQAGSTGGTIGKQGKSVSGSEDQHPTPHRKNSVGAGCNLGATWSNVFSGGSSIWTISPNGTAVENGGGNARGHAALSGHRLVINMHNIFSQGIYVVTLNQACTAGSGTISITGGHMAGTVIPIITFTTIPTPAN